MKVFIYSSASAVTGGPEALHQMAHKAGQMGFDVSVVYFPEAGSHAVPEPYKSYNVKVAASAIDAADSIVVFPEVLTHVVARFKKATRVIWWLSVDNYFNAMRKREEAMHRKGWKKKFSSFLGGYREYLFQPEERLYHAAQSEYARQFLISKGVERVFMLTDYLRRDFLERASLCVRKREDNIVYNPLKGIEFTRQLMDGCNFEANWIPIQGMTHLQVQELLSRSKVYIDFGTHPGRDRIPREAAICGCCVITGMRGSAANSIDVPIPEKYKFDEREPDILSGVASMLADILQDYNSHARDLDAYRETIVCQEQSFEREVGALFSELSQS